jgi:xenotropic and polytropic retrovirus receptor 1
MSRIGKLIPTAHEQDFERKKTFRLSDRYTPDNMDGWGGSDDSDTQNVVDMERSWYIHS